jgi:hypothetical protein
MPLVPCERCSCHHAADAATCPHCGARSPRTPAVALLLVLGLVSGCIGQPAYGSPSTDDTRPIPTSVDKDPIDSGDSGDSSDTGTER